MMRSYYSDGITLVLILFLKNWVILAPTENFLICISATLLNLHLKGLNRMVVVSFWNAIKWLEINLICFPVGQGINRIKERKIFAKMRYAHWCSFQPFLLISRSTKKVLDLFLILLFSSSSSFFAIVTGAPTPAVLWRWALWYMCNIYVECYEVIWKKP